MPLRLTELGVTRRLTWAEVADIQADHEADLEQAREQAVADVELEAALNGRELATNRLMILYRTLDQLLDPRRVA